MATGVYLNRIARIQAIVASYYKLNYEDMFSPVRDTYVCHPRQVAMYLVREITGASTPIIGRRFRKDHTTVLSALKAVDKRLQIQPWLPGEMDTLRKRIARETKAVVPLEYERTPVDGEAVRG